MCVLLANEEHIARKSHFCDGCEGIITPGTLYVRQRVTDGPDIWTWRAHPACHDAVGRIMAEYNLDCTDRVDPEHVREWMETVRS
jgi:hypothetical protein